MVDNKVKIMNYVIQNCQMGIDSLEKLKKYVDDTDMQKEINEELQAYQERYAKAKKVICECGGEIKPVPCMQKIMACIGVKFNAMMDNTTSHIAEMLIQGTNMGIIELTKIKNSNPSAEEDKLLDVVNDLLDFEIGRLDKLKKFL